MEVDGIKALLQYNDDETYVFFHKQPEWRGGTQSRGGFLGDLSHRRAIGNDGE